MEKSFNLHLHLKSFAFLSLSLSPSSLFLSIIFFSSLFNSLKWNGMQMHCATADAARTFALCITLDKQRHSK